MKFSGNLLKCEVISAAAAAQEKSEGRGPGADDDCRSVVGAGSLLAGCAASVAGGMGMGATGSLVFRPFSDNRQAFLLRRRNEKNPYPKGRVTFFTGLDRTLFEAKIDLTKFL